MTGRLRRFFRSAITGRFVSRLFASQHEDTTIQQTEPLPILRAPSGREFTADELHAALDRARVMRSDESGRVD